MSCAHHIPTLPPDWQKSIPTWQTAAQPAADHFAANMRRAWAGAGCQCFEAQVEIVMTQDGKGRYRVVTNLDDRGLPPCFSNGAS